MSGTFLKVLKWKALDEMFFDLPKSRKGEKVVKLPEGPRSGVHAWGGQRIIRKNVSELLIVATNDSQNFFEEEDLSRIFECKGTPGNFVKTLLACFEERRNFWQLKLKKTSRLFWTLPLSRNYFWINGTHSKERGGNWQSCKIVTRQRGSPREAHSSLLYLHLRKNTCRAAMTDFGKAWIRAALASSCISSTSGVPTLEVPAVMVAQGEFGLRKNYSISPEDGLQRCGKVEETWITPGKEGIKLIYVERMTRTIWIILREYISFSGDSNPIHITDKSTIHTSFLVFSSKTSVWKQNGDLKLPWKIQRSWEENLQDSENWLSQKAGANLWPINETFAYILFRQ